MPRRTQGSLTLGEYIFAVVFAIGLTLVVAPFLTILMVSGALSLNLIEQSEDLIVQSLFIYPAVFIVLSWGFVRFLRDRSGRSSL